VIIIGVVKDAHFQSLHERIEPRLFYTSTRFTDNSNGIVLLRVKNSNIPATIAYIKKVWESVNSIAPFEYFFLDESYDALYKNDTRTGVIATSMSCLAIFISCIGLFGLASFMSEQRTKEIGIRKILGAPLRNILTLFSREIITWICMANILALPAVYLINDKILQQYAYKTTVGFGIYIAGAIIVLLVATTAMSYQSIRITRTNPVNSLRHE
jgi:putative ABC transport system permease protein